MLNSYFESRHLLDLLWLKGATDCPCWMSERKKWPRLKTLGRLVNRGLQVPILPAFPEMPTSSKHGTQVWFVVEYLQISMKSDLVWFIGHSWDPSVSVSLRFTSYGIFICFGVYQRWLYMTRLATSFRGATVCIPFAAQVHDFPFQVSSGYTDFDAIPLNDIESGIKHSQTTSAIRLIICSVIYV